MANDNPDLPQTVGGDPVLGVPKLAALTPPMETTLLHVDSYFICSLKTGSMHRTDGKRISFVNGFYKTRVKEDIEYLDKEIAAGNIYIRRCTPAEIEQARMLENPFAVVREKVEVDILNELTIEALEKLIIQKKQGQRIVPDSRKIAETEKSGAVAGNVRITPTSTKDLGAMMAASISKK